MPKKKAELFQVKCNWVQVIYSETRRAKSSQIGWSKQNKVNQSIDQVKESQIKKMKPSKKMYPIRSSWTKPHQTQIFSSQLTLAFSKEKMTAATSWSQGQTDYRNHQERATYGKYPTEKLLHPEPLLQNTRTYWCMKPKNFDFLYLLQSFQ